MITKFEIFINEGLIKTTPLKKFLKILKRFFPDYYVGKGSDEEIIISAGRTEYISEIKKIANICNQLGWFISHGNIVDSSTYYKYNDPIFFDNQKYEEIIIKPKFDQKDIFSKPTFLYHVTPIKNVEKILKIGLIPKSKNKTSFHPDRIYLTDTLEIAWSLIKQFERIEKVEYTILKIESKNLNVKLYSDIDLRQNGYYTLENIPPKYITVLPKENYKKHWFPKNDETGESWPS